ncbi:MAG: hypothetical protein AAGA77_12675 [Bacteroidota bacterium]
MNQELLKYNCSEYLNAHYTYGMFHPTEAYGLFSHTKIIEDKENHHLQIGEIWDDVDSKICYRENKQGIWGRYNYDGKYYLLSETLKDFVEGWYQWNSNYWGAMPSDIQWIEIAIFYKNNIDRYNWKANELMKFVTDGIEEDMLTKFYIKAHENSLSISSINGFTRRPNNMVDVRFNSEKEKYYVYYKSNFFKDEFSNKFDAKNLNSARESIKEWIEKQNKV